MSMMRTETLTVVPRQSVTWRLWRRLRQPVLGILWYLVMLAASAVVLIPIVLVIFGSFKTVPEFFSTPYGPPLEFDPFNYQRGWEEANLQRATVNSVIATVLGVAVSTILSCLAAYGIARYAFRLQRTAQMLFIGGLVVPVQLIIIPIFIIMRQTGLLGSLWSLIVVYSVLGIPMGVLVMTGFFRALPKDLEEAARIDGASEFEIFWRIMLPLTRPALAAVIILNGVWMWNDFFLGLVLLTREASQTLPVAIMAFRGSYSTEWGLIFASVVISVAPVVLGYVLLSRQFIAGLTAGSVKG